MVMETTHHTPSGLSALGHPHSATAHLRPKRQALMTVIRSLYLSLAITCLFGAPCSATSRQPIVPSDLQLLIIIKTTLIAYNQANLTGNYTVLRDLAGPAFQQANTAARLSEIFQGERTKSIDISAVVLLQPKLLRQPSIDARGFLHVEGYFPSNPEKVHFLLAFQSVADRWQLAALGVKTFAPAPVAPSGIASDLVARNSRGKTVPTANELAQSLTKRWPYWTYQPYSKAAMR
jgi:hypothetical protein